MNEGSSSDQRHERISELFIEACDQPANQRLAYLRNRCGDDPDLIQEVIDLLGHDREHAVIDHPVIRIDWTEGPVLPGTVSAKCPSRIGHYEIDCVLGQGGMGTVYQARQAHTERMVALKVINPGMLSHSTIRRFELEARLLGRLHHPNIAQIHEAGVADAGMGSQPYFAMELVSGQPLLEYAKARQLNRRARLELVARMCDGVQHAHQQGIIHRDLKPTNIVVDESGQPKILDFGVARVTDSDLKVTTLQTTVGQIIGTLPYMSPEQVGGVPESVDARTDVYAIGVIAYELLSDRLPFPIADKPISEAARAIQHDAPARLSTIDRALRGDVETIVGKAMERDKERRYQSAAELAADIRRFLRDEPIIARPPSAMYQMGKFARRNRALVGGAAVAVILLIAAIIGTSYGLVVARAQRDEARRAADKAEAVRQFFLGILTTPAPGVVGRDVKVVDALSAVEEDLVGAFPDQPEILGDVHAELAVTFAKLGEFDRAEHHARQSLDIRMRTLGESHNDTLKSMSNLGNILMQPSRISHAGARDEARTLLDRGVTLARSNNRVLKSDLIDMLNNRASLAYAEAQLELAETLTREALALAVEHLGDSSTQALTSRQNLAILLNRQGESEQAAAELSQVAQQLESARGERDPSTFKARLALLGAMSALHQYENAEAIYLRTIPLVKQVMGEQHADTVNWLNNYATMLGKMKRRVEAMEIYRDALARSEASLGRDAFMTIVIKDSLSIQFVELGRFDEAEPLLRDCVQGLTALHGEAAESTLQECYRLVDVLIRLNKADEAALLANRYYTIASERFESEALVVAVCRSAVIQTLLATGQYEQAGRYLDDLVRDCPKIPADAHFVVHLAIENVASACEDSPFRDVAKTLRDRLLP